MKGSSQERSAIRRRELTYIDMYPDIDRYHRNDFMRYLDRVNAEYLVKRKTLTKAVDHPEKAEAYRDAVRNEFREAVGPLPDGTNANRSFVAETHDKGKYGIDAVYIETLPDHYASASFYYPKKEEYEGPRPAILFLCGHAGEGKANVTYVSFCVEAALNGFCVLEVDPPGQGEGQIPVEGTGGPWRTAVDAHCLLDRKLSLLGEHLGAYMIHDNVKSLDYLLGRPEVDGERVGVTGNSGGGTMSAYMGAYDDRIKAVAPSCWITELRSLLFRIMAQDAEQCLPGFMKRGLDHSDLVTAAAPKPYLIASAMFDFYPIDGVRDAFIEAKGMYRYLGVEDQLELYVALKGHGLWHDTRESVLRFFCRHFGVTFVEDKGIDYERLPDEALLNGGSEGREVSFLRKSLIEIIRGRAEEARRAAAAARTRPLRDRLLETLLLTEEQVSTALAGAASARREKCGPSQSDWSGERQLAFESEPGMRITADWRPIDDRRGGVLLSVGESDRSVVDALAAEGGYSAIMTVHPRGTGPAAIDPQSCFNIFDPESASSYNARMLGMTLQGMRVLDALAAIRELRGLQGADPARGVTLYGKNEHALTALYAAILAGIRDIRPVGLPRSFLSLLQEDGHSWSPAVYTPGLLKLFDVEDLLQGGG